MMWSDVVRQSYDSDARHRLLGVSASTLSRRGDLQCERMGERDKRVSAGKVMRLAVVYRKRSLGEVAYLAHGADGLALDRLLIDVGERLPHTCDRLVAESARRQILKQLAVALSGVSSIVGVYVYRPVGCLQRALCRAVFVRDLTGGAMCGYDWWSKVLWIWST